jgi:hypothetical protein
MKLLGTETYKYQSNGWNVTIQHPVVANPIYKITADYTASSEIGIPYRVIWQGTWKQGTITEISFIFAQ